MKRQSALLVAIILGSLALAFATLEPAAGFLTHQLRAAGSVTTAAAARQLWPTPPAGVSTRHDLATRAAEATSRPGSTARIEATVTPPRPIASIDPTAMPYPQATVGSMAARTNLTTATARPTFTPATSTPTTPAKSPATCRPEGLNVA